MGVLEKVAATEFLGQEFATWLYWQSETNGGKIKITDVEEFECWFESPIHLVSDYGEATEIVVKGGTPLEGPEARQAFRENKKVARSRVRINYRNQTYTFSFNASNFSISGLKIPTPPGAAGPDYVFMRLEIFEEFERFFESIYEAFLKIRLDDKSWTAERKNLTTWISSFELA